MSIATAIEDLSGRIQGAYDAISAMGGTMPQVKDTYHLSAAIESIPTGDEMYGISSAAQFLGVIQPNGTLTLDGSMPFRLNVPANSIMGTQQMMYKFYYNPNITEASFPNLSDLGTNTFGYCFHGCRNLSSISFPELRTV